MASKLKSNDKFRFFSPLIRRELQDVARRPWTIWSRTLVCFAAVALFVIVIGAGSNAGMAMTEGSGGRIAAWLFAGLFIAATATGLYSTSDSISSERRQGTLGLLFLTRLAPNTVLIAKLVSSSFQNFYALLAAFPILSTCLIAGGVSVAYILKASIAVLYALALAAFIGLLESCKNEDTHAALSRSIRQCIHFQAMPVVSPMMMFVAASLEPSFYSRLYFWISVGVGLGMIGHLWMQCRRHMATHWGSLPAPVIKPPPDVIDALCDFNSLKKARTPTIPYDNDPAAWLIARFGPRRWIAPRNLAIIYAFVLGAFFLTGLIPGNAALFGSAYVVFTSLPRFFLLISMCLVAPQGLGRALSQDSAEILLTTPLTVESLIHGARRYLLRQFKGVIFTLATADLLCLLIFGLSQGVASSNFSALAVALAASNIAQFLGLGATAVFGVWMGLRHSILTQAVIRAALFQIVVPVICLIAAFSLGPRVFLLIGGWHLAWIVAGLWQIARFVRSYHKGSALHGAT